MVSTVSNLSSAPYPPCAPGEAAVHSRGLALLSLSHGDAGVVLLPKRFRYTFQPVYVLPLSCLRNVSLCIFFSQQSCEEGEVLLSVLRGVKGLGNKFKGAFKSA